MFFTVLSYICVELVTCFIKSLRKLARIIIFNFYFSLFYLAFFVALLIWPFPILNGRTLENGKTWAGILKHVTKLMGVKWELRNGEHLDADHGAVVVANHQSVLDSIGMLNIWNCVHKMSIIAKQEALYAGPLGILTYFAGILYVDKKNPKKAYKQLEEITKVLKEKVKILIFPEGTRNYDQTKFLPFKKGAFVMAINAQAPIIPIVFSPYYFVDRKRYIFKRGRAIIQCLEEVPTTGLTLDDVPELIERVRNMMLATYKKLCDEVNAYNSE